MSTRKTQSVPLMDWTTYKLVVTSTMLPRTKSKWFLNRYSNSTRMYAPVFCCMSGVTMISQSTASTPIPYYRANWSHMTINMRCLNTIGAVGFAFISYSNRPFDVRLRILHYRVTSTHERIFALLYYPVLWSPTTMYLMYARR